MNNSRDLSLNSLVQVQAPCWFARLTLGIPGLHHMVCVRGAAISHTLDKQVTCNHVRLAMWTHTYSHKHDTHTKQMHIETYVHTW